MTTPHALVLFDLDGTLIDSAPDLAGAANATVLNWDQGQGLSPGGTISFDGTRVTGTNIGFDLMNASGTAADGVYHCSNAGGTVALGANRGRIARRPAADHDHVECVGVSHGSSL